MSLRFYIGLLLFGLAHCAAWAHGIENYQNFQHRIDSLYYFAEYQTGAELLRHSFGDNDPDSVTAYLHYKLGTFTLELADYSDAEEHLLKAKGLYSTVYSPHHELVASALSRLATLYSEQGRYSDAVAAVTEQLEDYKLEFGNDNKFTALAAIALAEYYLQAKNISGAEQVTSSYLPRITKAYPSNSIESARSKKLLGSIAFSKREYSAAEKNFTDALTALPPDRPVPSLRGVIELERARSRSILTNDELAHSDIRNAIADITSSRNASTLLVAKCHLVAGVIEETLGRMNTSVAAYQKAFETYRIATKENFRYSSERERLTFLRDIKNNSGRLFSTVMRSSVVDPSISTLAYNWLLFQKGLLLSSIQSIRSSCRCAKDTAITRLLDRCAELRSRRSAFITKDKLLLQKPYYTADTLDKVIAALEKQLTKRSAAYARFTNLGSASWKDVRRKLRANDRAIELAVFPYFDGERETDTSYYAAYVLNAADMLYPKIITLGSTRKLEDPAILRAYNRYVRSFDKTNKAAALEITKLLWRPLERAVDSAGMLYISSDGIYSRFSIGAFVLDDNTFLMDKYAITTLANTADLLRDTLSTTSSIVIVADPDFGKIISTRSLPPLPATLTEANSISELFKKTNWQTSSLISTQASEQEVRKLRHPCILHIATHGKFRSIDSVVTATSEDMVQSSLYFCGANKTLASGSIDPANDGILSGLEAMDLDLEGTSLVTLSACESGLGTIEPGEGVFGFPRAFRIAGASNVLMSMWPIPDKETAELMNIFYQQLSEGQPKAEALRTAQREMRQIVKKRYHEERPQYWAGFVLFGF